MRTSVVQLVLALLCQTMRMALCKEHDEPFIGWRGEVEVANDEAPRGPDLWIETISWKPRAFILHNLITDAEAQHIVDLAWPQMQRSTVVGKDGSSVLDDYRTSYGTFLTRYQDDIVKSIEERVALHTRAPVSHQEDVQVLRYGVGEYYHSHRDSLPNDSPRMATVLIYLADPEVGGETAFPEGSEWANAQAGEKYSKEFSDCAKGSVAFKPRRGDALLFWSANPDGKTIDPASTHEGCAVESGSKWTTTIWVHTQPFRPAEFNPKTGRFRANPPFLDPGICRDKNLKSCKAWAEAGECEKNPNYMKGSGMQGGMCRKSCGACEECAENDKECFMNNRRRLGYLVG
ncbi:hypothetical protein DUNSADRAFT_14992 [Dunaliella salina]|uniref:Procollagen-proline 4-dioxygenase n=1 Tax=Dunaliella salina TaxID=3046 RepID=A0ABQ7H2A3_DUNSA|nr:hypothetical protein DUNSADRAFT_14992 [Dunaliella salina]|eukprot:KAF5840968.1 hypothetical protein DUNSADRAFT_14992 [Dunaliella salina]